MEIEKEGIVDFLSMYDTEQAMQSKNDVFDIIKNGFKGYANMESSSLERLLAEYGFGDEFDVDPNGNFQLTRDGDLVALIESYGIKITNKE